MEACGGEAFVGVGELEWLGVGGWPGVCGCWGVGGLAVTEGAGGVGGPLCCCAAVDGEGSLAVGAGCFDDDP